MPRYNSYRYFPFDVRRCIKYLLIVLVFGILPISVVDYTMFRRSTPK